MEGSSTRRQVVFGLIGLYVVVLSLVTSGGIAMAESQPETDEQPREGVAGQEVHLERPLYQAAPAPAAQAPAAAKGGGGGGNAGPVIQPRESVQGREQVGKREPVQGRQ